MLTCKAPHIVRMFDEGHNLLREWNLRLDGLLARTVFESVVSSSYELPTGTVRFAEWYRGDRLLDSRKMIGRH